MLGTTHLQEKKTLIVGKGKKKFCVYRNVNKNKNKHIVRTVPKIVETKTKSVPPNIHTHDHSLSYLGTGISLTVAGLSVVGYSHDDNFSVNGWLESVGTWNSISIVICRPLK